ncbi:MAG: Gfo/Idh/MocA family oxidoreductase [Acidobacteria bacterium]|nr:Gfo/Idh/MocA family oxidoreductase [Acidobacteriota bacterium]
MDDVRFGLVGCGRVSTRHVDALVRHVPGARLVAVCDIVPERAQRYGAQLGIPAFASAAEMYRAVDIDVVDIATPSGDHYARAMEALAHDKHVVVEKPVALRPEHAQTMIREAAGRGCQLWVAHQNRYNRALSRARAEVASGRLGKPVLGTVRVRWSRDQSYYDGDNWHGTWLMDGGVTSQQAIHHLDALLWCMGPIEYVDASCATRLVRMECEDLAVATLRFKSGALGIIEATTATRPRDIEASLSVLGEGGVVVLGGLAMNRIEHWEFADTRDYDATVKTDYFEYVPNAYGFGHDTLYNRVVRSVRDGGPIEIPADEGLRSIELLHAIYASHERGARVVMDQSPASRKLGLRAITIDASTSATGGAQAIAACLSNRIDELARADRYVAGIIGEQPSRTAKSPSIWNHAIRQLGVDASYVSFDVDAGKLAPLVRALRAWPLYVGGSVTMPYKVEIAKHLDDLTPAARLIGAVNTIFRNPEGRLIGDNTDGAGAVAALVRGVGGDAPFIPSLAGMRVLLVGAGGAGRAVAVALADAIGEGSLLIMSRTPAHADEVAALARARHPRVTSATVETMPTRMAGIDLLVNCTACGQVGLRTAGGHLAVTLEPYSPLADVSPTSVARAATDADTLRAWLASNLDGIERNTRASLSLLMELPSSARVFDIVYAPAETVLLRQSRMTGHPALNGKLMNLQQAVTAMFDVVFKAYFNERGLATDQTRQAILRSMTEVW